MEETALRIDKPFTDKPFIEIEQGAMGPPPADATFAELVGDELPRLQRMALLLSSNRADADDLVAETIARTLPKWRSGVVADPPAYLRRVMVNTATRRWRRRRLALRRDRVAVDWLQPAGDHTAATVERDRTVRAIATLPPRRRAVVVLRFYEDLAEAQIAEVLGISDGTVKSTLSRALEQLRVELGTLEGT
ncbi:MAG: SigE family RNA polymerase sigma factor [Actinomycetota bacterium]|nr:SigE family RNA polymerase sigma factor [Actinomycetota bacterium]